VRRGVGAGASSLASEDRACGPSDLSRCASQPEALVPLRKPRLLDLFCGAGGAAVGYHQAGFDVVGIDIKPQPNYPFAFLQHDVMKLDPRFLRWFDAIHASPPCQLFTVYRNNSKQTFRSALNLIPETRALLKASERPWVMENVPGAPLERPIRLCGTSFPPLEVRRHRMFESNIELTFPPCNHGRLTERKYPGSTNRPNGRTVCNIGEYRVPLSLQKKAIGIDWMNLEEISEAIPPAYTQHIGCQLLAAIATEARRAETVQLGSVHEGAGLVEASPNPSPKTCAS
jgi:DNA (cytosine-5)-methyltransferase 1